MKQFIKIPSLIQIFVAEWLAVMFLFPIVSKLYEWTHPNIGYNSLPLDKVDFLFFVIALLLYFWLLREILRPKIKTDWWVGNSGADWGGDYSFASTHPSYVFIDVLACGFWLFVRWAWSEGWQERTYQGTILIAMAATIPAVRLIAWYGLRLRPRKAAAEVKNSWKPVALFYLLVLGIILVTTIPVLFMVRHQNREQQQKEANLTVVETGNWKGSETFDALRDPDFYLDGQIGTRVIRLRPHQKSSASLTCSNNAGQGNFATVLATLGNYDYVLIFSRIAPSSLVQRAQGNEGKPIEVMGRLTQMPSRIPAWKKYCGLEELSPRPRWVFEEQLP
jgi:hypothetical protein